MVVSLAGQARTIVGAPSVEITATTVAELLARLSTRLGPAGHQLVGENGTLRPAFIILVNGRNIQFLQGPQTPLSEADEVSILSAAAGG